MEFKELIKTLSDEVGFDGEPAADEDGVIRLPLSQIGALALMEVAETRSLLMWCRVGELPERNAERLKDALLRANFMGQAVDGGTLSLSEDGGIYLHRYLPLDLTDADRFMETLTAFVELVVNWTRLVAESAFAFENAANAETEGAAGAFELNREGIIRG